MGQLQSAVVMALVGFIPGYFVSLVLAKFGLLRVPPKAEMAGLDIVEVPLQAYPESVPAYNGKDDSGVSVGKTA
jgi:ammonia channel protein AmtB